MEKLQKSCRLSKPKFCIRIPLRNRNLIRKYFSMSIIGPDGLVQRKMGGKMLYLFDTVTVNIIKIGTRYFFKQRKIISRYCYIENLKTFKSLLDSKLIVIFNGIQLFYPLILPTYEYNQVQAALDSAFLKSFLHLGFKKCAGVQEHPQRITQKPQIDILQS